MDYVRLGSAGLKVSRICLGMMSYGSRAERAWHDFEEQYVRAHVPPTFPRKVADTWLAELDKVRDAGRADKVRVENYLVRTDQFGTVRP